jgi:H2-forming N5,N10-methylenetetrahydromethanopterin dehydrogenase-like enzyme
MHDFSEHTLGKSTEDGIKITTREENAAATVEMVKQCHQKLSIISQELDPNVYDQPDFLEALRKLAINNRYVEIRIIVFEPELIVRRGHKLLDLSGKISSFIELRKVSSKYKSFNEAVLIADEVGYIYRESTERYKGKVNFNSRRESKHLLDVFNTMWETAKPDPNLRWVHI